VKLRGKLLLTLVPVVAGAVLALGCVVYLQLQAEGEESLRREMESRLTEVESLARSRLESIRANSKVFGTSTLVKRYMRERHAMIRPAVLALLISYREAHPEYREIRLLTLDGFEDTRVADDGLPNVEENEGDQPWFRATMAADGAHLSILRSPDDGSMVALLARKVMLHEPGADPMLETGQVSGVLAVTVALDRLAGLVARRTIGQTGYLEILDEDGAVVFSPDHSRIGTSLSTITQRLTSMTMTVPEKHRVHGRSSRVLGRWIDDGLGFIAVAPDSEFVASCQRLAMTVALFTLVASAAATAFVYLALSRLVLAPLKALDRQARHIGSERFDQELCVRTDDELGELARAFVDMGQRLRVTLDELRRSHAHIETLAYQDSLTRLFNRRRFLQMLEASLETATVSQSRVALYFLDLDDFKIINDTLGHDRGDELLVEIAERLSEVFDTNGERHVARLGGDEFTAILPVYAETFSIERFTETLCQTLGAPIRLGGQELVVATSVGVAVFPDVADSVETLMRCADTAMYNAKRQGKGTWFRFDSAMNDVLQHSFTLENDLRQAALESSNTQFHLQYQPQLDVRAGTFSRIEATLCWQHPELGEISPELFMSTAVRIGLTRDFGDHTLRTVCAEWSRWRHRHPSPAPVAIKLSALHVTHHDFIKELEIALAASDMPHDALEIELSESSLMELPEDLHDSLRALRNSGIRVAINDFGGGNLALDTLLQLPVDTLKINRRFIAGLHTDIPREKLTQAICTLAHTIGLEMVATGVESEEELTVLRRVGCDRAQGNLIAAPTTGTKLDALLSTLFERNPVSPKSLSR